MVLQCSYLLFVSQQNCRSWQISRTHINYFYNKYSHCTYSKTIHAYRHNTVCYDNDHYINIYIYIYILICV